MFKPFAFGTLVGAFIVAVAWVAISGLGSAALSRGTAAVGARSPEGLLVVTFSVITAKSQNSESSQDGEIGNVTAVEFHPAFIVVQTKDGGGTVFLPDKIKAFNWRLKKVEPDGQRGRE